LKVGPWLAPVGTVFAVQRAVKAHFTFPDLVAWPVAVVIEILGIGTIYLMLIMDDWNRRRSGKSSDPKARAGLARFLVVLYIATTITLVILLDVLPELNRWALAVLPLVSVVAYLALSLFAEYEYMERGRDEARREQKERRKAAQVSKMDARLDTLLTLYLDKPHLTPTEAASRLGCTRQTVYNRLEVLESQGRIRRNGKGVEVL
jgi:hypothetical protein